MENKVKDLRDKIDEIDLKILDLIQSRAIHASKIGQIKKESPDFDGVFYKPEREKEIIKEKHCLKRGYTVFWKGHVGIMADEKNCIHANAFHMEVTKEPLIDIISRTEKHKKNFQTCPQNLPTHLPTIHPKPLQNLKSIPDKSKHQCFFC